MSGDSIPKKKITEEQFSELFKQYYEELCRFVFPVVKDKDAAEDVVQDVFVKIWTRREELEITTTYKAYLFKAVVFRGLDYLRKQKTVGKVKEELKIVHNQSQQETYFSVEEKELIAAIDAGIDHMPENMRIIFQLSRFSSLKNREIAEQLNISIKTVESNVSKALKQLAVYLRPYVKNQNLKSILWLTLWYLLNR